MRALLVEDDEICFENAYKILLNYYEKVDRASDGKVALKLFKKNKYDIVFLDIGLPDMSGLVLCEEMSAKRENNENTPIVALTICSQEFQKIACKYVGMETLISKPLTNKKIEDYMNGKF